MIRGWKDGGNVEKVLVEFEGGFWVGSRSSGWREGGNGTEVS